MPPVSSPRRGEVRGGGMRGQGWRCTESEPPHPTLRATFSPAGRRTQGAPAQSYALLKSGNIRQPTPRRFDIGKTELMPVLNRFQLGSRSARRQPALHDYLQANVSHPGMQNLLFLIALGMDYVY